MNLIAPSSRLTYVETPRQNTPVVALQTQGIHPDATPFFKNPFAWVFQTLTAAPTPSTTSNPIETWQNNTTARPVENQPTGEVNTSGETVLGNLSEEDKYNLLVMMAFEGREGIDPNFDDYDGILGVVNNRYIEQDATGKKWQRADASLKDYMWDNQQFVVMADIVKGQMDKQGISAISSKEDAIKIIAHKFGGVDNEQAIQKATELVNNLEKKLYDKARFENTKQKVGDFDSWKSSDSNPAGGVQLAGTGGNKFHMG